MGAYGGNYEGNVLPVNRTDNGQLAGFGRAVRYGFPYRINVYGDSTGNDSTDWPRRMVTMSGGLGSLWPAVNFTHLAWDDTAQGYVTYSQQQVGSAGVPYLTVTGSTVQAVTTPHTSAMNVTDLEFECLVYVNDWTESGEHVIAACFGSAGNRVFRVYVSSGTLFSEWSTDGTTQVSHNMGTSVALGLSAGWYWLKYTLDVNNGASGYTSTLAYRAGTTYGSYTTLATTTGGATTSLYASGTAPLCFGCRAASTSSISAGLTGRLAVFMLKSGIGGSIISGWSAGLVVSGASDSVGIMAETWTQRSSIGGTQTALTKTGGSEVLTLNGSVAGSVTSYADDNTRFPKMTPGPSDLAVYNYGHNESTNETTFAAAAATFLSRVRTTSPNTAIMVSIQNPQLTGATNPGLHARRCQGLRQLAAIQRYAYVDAYKTFVDYGDYATDLMTGGGDYVHPNATGYDTWAMAAVRSFAGWQ